MPHRPHWSLPTVPSLGCVGPRPRLAGSVGPRPRRLLAEVTDFARACGMAFIILFADDDRLYARNGWARVSNRCSWVKIHDHATLGIARQEDTGAMMVKAVGEQAWPEGDVDLLGHLFRKGQPGHGREKHD